MSTITKEQAKDLRNAFQCWQQDYDPVEDKEQYDMFGLGMVAMDALLASLEPVSVIKIDHESSLIKHVKKVVSETNAPPAQVSVPDEATPDNIQMLASTFAPRGVTYQWDSDECNAATDSWNACRAAMLQGDEPVTTAYKLPEEIGSSLQLRNLIRQRHAEWSQATFGDVGPIGPLKHLSKEALEAAAEPDDLSEWADMQFLLWDAQRRAGISDGEITAAMEEKLKVNMARHWPEPKDGEPRLHIKSTPHREDV